MAGRISPADLVRLATLVGPTTLARGQAYASRGAVIRAEWDEAGTSVSGLVAGTQAAPYEVSATLVRAPATRALTRLAGECTCPIGWNCKHAVALVLAGAASPPARASTVWEALVAGDAPDDPEAGAAIALQLELVARRPPPGRRQAATGEPARPGVRARPVVPGQRGWVRTGVSWNRLDYMGHSFRDGLSRDRVELLRELRALAGLGDTRSWTVYGDDNIWLESVPSRRLWDLLRQAEEVDLPLVNAARGATVTFSPEPLTVAVDLHRGGDGTVVADAGLPSDRLFVGRPAHGLIWWHGADLHLAALAAPLPDHLRSLVEHGPTGIGDGEYFAGRVLPVLRRQVKVTSSDGSVDLPDVGADRVVLGLTYSPGPVVDAAWRLEATGRAPRPVTARPDPDAAAVLRRALAQLQPPFAGTGVPADVRVTGLDAMWFVTETVPALAAAGVEVHEVGERPDFREVHDAPVVSWTEGEKGRDWFDLRVALTVGGQTVEFAELFTALAEGQSHLLLPSGAYFSLDSGPVRRLAELIAEARALNDSPPGAVRVSRYQTSLLDDLATAGELPSGVADALAELASDPLDRPIPEGVEANLRPYQADGFQWLAARWERGLGAVLADDMGLGKTLQALTLIAHARRADPRPWLVVAPTSVVTNWVREAERFVPGLRCVMVTETSRRSRLDVDGAALVVTSYTLFRIDHAEYERVEWAGLLLDEAQFAKNPASHANQRARRLAAPWKLAMTGTPMENSLTELWAITSITSPGLLGRADRFDEIYRRPIERQGDGERLEQLRRRIRPWMLRRTKEEVAPELPEKQEQVLALELDPRHRRLYDTYLHRERQKVLGLLDDMRGNRFEILRSLTMLRQAALDLSLVDPKHAGVPSTKLDELTGMLEGIVADGHRVLVFSQFTRFLGSARRRVEDLGIECCYLDGSTRRRAEVIDRFRSGQAPVFLISLKAGGFGLNLTEADYCILLDPWWNPAAEAQAVDRAHRIGQTRPVMVYRLVASGTIEDKVMALRDRKAALFASVMSGGGFESARLDADDVRELLADA